MAFNYNPKEIRFFKDHGDKKPPFRATGKGLAVDHRFRPDQFTANASLTARLSDGSAGQKFYLFVDRVSTAWSLSGETAQARQSRSFYPRNLSQADFLIEGICPSQAEYDRLVEFVQAHHLRITDVGDNPTIDDTPNQTSSVSFMMGKPRDPGAAGGFDQARRGRPGTYRHAPSIFWDVAVTSIAAGHERFKFQPAFSLTCKVLDDRLQSNKEIEYDIMKALTYNFGDYRDAFGTLGNPTAATDPRFTTLGTLVASTQQRLTFDAGSGGSGGGGFAPGDPSWPVASNAQYIGRAAAAAQALSNPEAGQKIKDTFTGCVPPDPGKQYFGQWNDLRSDGTVDPDNIVVKYRDPPGGGNTIKV